MKIDKAGDQLVLQASATLAERMNLSQRLRELKQLGHAVVADEVTASGEQTGEIRVIHYRSCMACMGLSKGASNG